MALGRHEWPTGWLSDQPTGTAGARQLRRLRQALAERQLLSVTINSRTVPGAELLDCRRHRQRIAEARQFGMFLARTVLRLSQTRAGLIFGRDRTTIRHACRQVIARGQADPRLMTQLGPALDIWAHRFATIAGTERSEP